MGRRLSQQPEVGAQVVSTLVTTVTNGLESFANDPEKFGGEIAIDALARAGIKTPDDCHDFFSGGLECEQSNPRTVWTNASQIPDDGGTESGILVWGCGYFTHSSQCSFTFSFRGIGSSDSDGDLASWSVDFGDGTSTSGSWRTAPPTEITHEYAFNNCRGANTPFPVCVITLTVTDAAGQSHSNSIAMVFVDQTPD